MEFNQYQEEARKTAIYPKTALIVYPTLGLCGEAGECAEKVKKIIRDKNGVFTKEDRESIKIEAGDALWYLSNLMSDCEITLEELAQANLDKLKSRQERGVLGGSGDQR
jgi:NTP pyrophosphatase (non-canonical NTP hydrolase)